MNTNLPTQTLRGIVSPLPSGSPCRVSLLDGEIEYHVLPRGAGADLVEMVTLQLEVVASVQEGATPDDPKQIQIRSYKVLDSDDDTW